MRWRVRLISVMPTRVEQADGDVQRDRVQGLNRGPDPLLAGCDDPPQQRVRLPPERRQQILRQVTGLVADLPEVLRPGQHAHDRDRQHERQGEPPTPLPPADR